MWKKIVAFGVFLVIAIGVAIENFFPPLPADTFVAFGAFLTAQGQVTGLGVFLVTWAMNTAGALLNYALARRWGRALLGTRAGRWALLSSRGTSTSGTRGRPTTGATSRRRPTSAPSSRATRSEATLRAMGSRTASSGTDRYLTRSPI